MTEIRFETAGLFAALDAKRESKGLSWAALAREVNRIPEQSPIAVSTFKGLAHRRHVEGDGVVQMLLWLGQPPESFVNGIVCDGTMAFPDVPDQKTLRWDTKAIYRSIDEARRSRHLSWVDVAAQIATTAPMLTRLSKGGRIAIGTVVKAAAWLERPAVTLTRITDK